MASHGSPNDIMIHSTVLTALVLEFFISLVRATSPMLPASTPTLRTWKKNIQWLTAGGSTIPFIPIAVAEVPDSPDSTFDCLTLFLTHGNDST